MAGFYKYQAIWAIFPPLKEDLLQRGSLVIASN
jgi:hypothetical protein